MAKSQKRNAGRAVSGFLSGKFSVNKALVVLSVVFNVALLGLLIAFATTDVFDSELVKRGGEVACSTSHHRKVAAKDSSVATNLEFSCVSENAKMYYLEGLNNYRESKGLQPVSSY